MLKLADAVLILINPSPSNVKYNKAMMRIKQCYCINKSFVFSRVSKFSNMLSPLLSPSKDNSCGSSAVTLEAATVATSGGGQQQHYSSTSRLNISGSSSEHSSPR